MSDGLLKALQNPALYDHPVTGFKLIQTHISWILLTGEYAYKIKKPMDFGFLDFTTLASRQFYCEEELRLNRRTAPDIYLGVVPVNGPAEAPSLGPLNEASDLRAGSEQGQVHEPHPEHEKATGEVIEYAVKMRQFDPEATLDALLDDPDALAVKLDHLALQVADFHQHQATPVAATSSLGTAAEVWAPVKQNFDQIRPLLSDAQELKQLDQLESWAECSYQCLQEMLTSRHKDGFVRECHGDMHFGNVTLIDGNPTLFDCIEFNEGFRWVDVINDLAFLLMDLDDRGLCELSARTRNQYLEQTGDYAGLRLLRFYKAYRAMVRCKIALFTMGAPGLPESVLQEERQKYQRYMGLAERYMNVPSCFLMIMHGVSGTGKSTISSHLLQHLKAVRVRSDVERKRLHGLQPLANSHSNLDGGIYTNNASEQTYDALATHADSVLRAGYPVILDATFLQTKHRQQMQALAEQHGVPFIVVDCQASQDVVEQRIETRQAAGNDAAEADVDVMHRQLETQDPLTPEECMHVVGVTGNDFPALDKLAQQLAEKLGAGY